MGPYQMHKPGLFGAISVAMLLATLSPTLASFNGSYDGTGAMEGTVLRMEYSGSYLFAELTGTQHGTFVGEQSADYADTFSGNMSIEGLGQFNVIGLETMNGVSFICEAQGCENNYDFVRQSGEADTDQVQLEQADPVASSSAQYYYSNAGVQAGPVPLEQLQALIDEGRLGRRCLPEPLTLEERMFQPGMTPELIGQNIRRIREARGLTVEKLAERMELDAATVLAYEDGVAFVFEEELVRIARALEIDDPGR